MGAQKRTLKQKKKLFLVKKIRQDLITLKQKLHVNLILIDCGTVSHIIDQEIDLCSLRKQKVQKLTDSNTEKRMLYSRNVLSQYTQKTLETAFFSDEKIFKACVRYFLTNFCFSLNDSPTKTIKDVFYL